MSLAASLRSPLPLRAKTYADSALEDWSPCPRRVAPTTIASPSSATAKPKLSASAPSDAMSLEVCVQLAPAPVNTYAAPRNAAPSTVLSGAPTTIVSPSIATDQPKPSPAAPSAAVSFATWVQVLALRVNT